MHKKGLWDASGDPSLTLGSAPSQGVSPVEQDEQALANQIHYVLGFSKILSSLHQQLTALNFLCKALWDQLIKNKALQEEDVSVKCSSIPGELCHLQHEATLFLYTMNTTEFPQIPS